MPIEPQAPYISTTEAAKRHHVTHDHVGLLCRRGKVQGMLLGRQWYVNEHSLIEYLKKSSEEKELRKQALSKQWRGAWTAAFVGLSLFAMTAQPAAADYVSTRPHVATVNEPIATSLSSVTKVVGEIQKQIPAPNIPAQPIGLPNLVTQENSFVFFKNLHQGVLVVAEAFGVGEDDATTFHITYAKDVEPESVAKTESITTVLTAAVANVKDTTRALPVPTLSQTAVAENFVTGENIARGIYIAADALADMLAKVAPKSVAPSAPTLSSETAAIEVTSETYEPLSMLFTAAATNAGAAAHMLPAPNLSYELPQVEPLLTSENVFAGIVVANETLSSINENMFALYASSVAQVARVAAFDTDALAHVWGKTFGAFGERFVGDMARLNDAQVNFYVAAARTLEDQYNSFADAVEDTQTFDTSISVASVNLVPTLTIPGKSQLASVWDGLVDFLAQTFFTPKTQEEAPAEVSSQTATEKTPSQKSSGLLSASKPAAGQTFVQKSSPTPVGPKQNSVAEPVTSESFVQASTPKSTNTYVTQVSLNKQFAAWMLVVKNLIAGNTGYIDNQAVAALGNGGGGTVNNYYSYAQRIDKLDGVTITNSSINGVSDFSNLGGADVLTDLTDTLVASPTYGDLLMYNGTKWVNTATSSLGIVAGGGSMTGTTGQLAYFSSTNTAVGTSSLFIGTNGRIGIGTTTPEEFLSIDSAASISKIQVNNSSSTGLSSIQARNSDGDNIEFLQFGRSAANNYFTGVARAGGAFLGGSPNTLFGIGTRTNTPVLFATNNLERFRIDTSGNIGIGTTTPDTKLTVWGTGELAKFGDDTTSSSNISFQGGRGSVGYTNNFAVLQGGVNKGIKLSVGGSFGGGTTVLTILGDSTGSLPVGNVGIGTTSPYAKLSVVGEAVAANFTATSTTATSTFMGSVGIGSTTPGLFGGVAAYLTIDRSSSNNYALLTYASTTGTISHIAFANSNGVVGTISTNGSATAYNTSSDRRIKDGIATTSLGIDTLLKLPVREFSFKNDSLHATTTGFIAQELYQVFPYAVTTNGDSGEDELATGTLPWSVDYGRITPLIVKAVQDIANITSSFKDNLIAWFADASNGITKLFVKEVHTDKLCVGSTCVSEEQFLALVAASSASNGGSSSIPEAPQPEENASSTPEVPVEEETASSTLEVPAEEESQLVEETPVPYEAAASESVSVAE